ncbi:MAG: ABC transporter permease [Candidatus Glassbacteria bacterium]|nr:ABC transporter permease [Candidatus Glassbacteria bacterium]
MKLSRNLLLSCEILSAHKLRTLLSVTGIVVGVGAVLLMVSFGRGAEKRILSLIRNLGTDLIVVNAGQTKVLAGRQRQVENVTTLEAADARVILQDCPSVKIAAPAVTKRVSAVWEAENTNTTVLGITPEGFALRNIRLSSGRIYDSMEGRARRRLAVVGPTVAQNLFLGQDPLGRTIRIGSVPFEVIGVSAPKGMDISGMDLDDIIIVPLETAMRRLLNVPYVNTIYVQALDFRSLDRAEAEIRSVLRERHRLRDKPDDFTIQNQATLLDTERETTSSMTLLIGSVAGISLLVGGVGILAVMLISVGERTREIGLRRALGATRGDIRTQFLLESGILALAGGFLGVLGGTVTALAFSTLGYWETVISWQAAGVGFFFAASVGVLFGLYPAARAAGLEPIEALRSE